MASVAFQLLLIFSLYALPARAAVNDPPVAFELRPLEDAHPAVARGERPSFSVSVPLAGITAARAWEVVKKQPELLNSMPAFSTFLNVSGEPGDWLIVVEWHTPSRWHRWLRTDVRKYFAMDDGAMTLSHFLVGGFGSWLPRLAFTERVVADDKGGSRLDIDVWYELDEARIGWPTDGLHNLTQERWRLFYGGSQGYADTLRELAMGAMTPRTCGAGAIQSTFSAWLQLKTLGWYEL